MRPQRRTPTALAPGVTLWRRIADDLEQAIALGTYAAGERLPGEVEIAIRFGVNRHTVRRALAELSERGLVRASAAAGPMWRAAGSPIRSARARGSPRSVGMAGRDPGGRLIGHGSESATPDIARRLGVKVGEAVVRLDILRSADRVPICWTTNWLPAARAADAARVSRASRSITATLAHFRHQGLPPAIDPHHGGGRRRARRGTAPSQSRARRCWLWTASMSRWPEHNPDQQRPVRGRPRRES